MSTRGAIMRDDGKGGYEGRYHHFDSYPTGLGKSLWDFYHGPAGRSAESMRQILIELHPAGWSTINGADWTKPAGFVEHQSGSTREEHRGPACYCHGDRHEDEQLLTCKGSEKCNGKDCDPLFIEWEYVLKDDSLLVLESHKDGDGPDGVTQVGVMAEVIGGMQKRDLGYRHRLVARIPWDGPEPDWDRLNKGAEQ